MAETGTVREGQKMPQAVNSMVKKSDNNAEPSRQAQIKRMSAGGGALVAFVAMVILLAAASIAVFLNVADSRMTIVGLLQSADPVMGREFDAFKAERASLMVTRSELDAEAAALEAERARLNAQDSQLAKREQALIDAEDEAAIEAENLAKAQQEREKMISVISKLDAKGAAQILTGLQDPREIVDILMVFKESFMASIITAMDPEIAIRVTQEALNRDVDSTFLEGLPYELLPDEAMTTPAPTPTPTLTPTPTPTPTASVSTAAKTTTKKASKATPTPTATPSETLLPLSNPKEGGE